jgi:6-pyruvoyltetrahydropterin/6-carboxytetrahydropterin synthase
MMEKLVYVTRRESFNAAHKLSRPDWSDEKNKEVFGKCANPNWHGHNYTLYVTVKGKVSEETGFVVNLKHLSVLIKDKVTERLDHKNLNVDVDFMKDVLASTEVLAIKIWEQLVDEIARTGCELHCIKLYETDNNYVEYYG